ncbi:MAG: isocitrate lyase/PEP mutase family protein [Pseudolabrys sp.]|jgi:2-methylisocitrate lyase-like PEP mutase family enzyme
MSKASELKALIKRGGMTIAPGAYDGITAKLIARAGFEAVYMTGAGTAAAHGYPDYGLLTMTEMVTNAGKIAATANLPVIADADTGYGNELNVVRTVHAYMRQGIAAIHIEDQVFPKKCGHLDNKEVIAVEEYIAKIRAAADARGDSDFMIIARTDSRAVIGFEEAIARANAALAAGADIAFVEAPQTLEEMAAVPKRVDGPCLLNVVRRGKTPAIELKDAEAMGYKLAILPTLLFRGVIGCCEELLDEVKKGVFPAPPKDLSPHEAFQRFGSDEWDELRVRYRDGAKPSDKAKVA